MCFYPFAVTKYICMGNGKIAHHCLLTLPVGPLYTWQEGSPMLSLAYLTNSLSIMEYNETIKNSSPLV